MVIYLKIGLLYHLETAHQPYQIFYSTTLSRFSAVYGDLTIFFIAMVFQYLEMGEGIPHDKFC